MIIDLLETADISGWQTFFQLFTSEKFVGLWEIINVSESFVQDPLPLTEFSKHLLDKGTEFNSSYQLQKRTLEDHQEFIRLTHLGNLCHVFGKITLYYGELDSRRLYDFAERNFIHTKSTFWWEWYYFLTGVLRKSMELSVNFSNEEYKGLILSIREATPDLNRRIARAKSELRVLGFDFPRSEQLIRILQQEYAYQIWKNINKNFTGDSRQRLFQWGATRSRQLGSRIRWSRMKRYCMNV